MVAAEAPDIMEDVAVLKKVAIMPIRKEATEVLTS